MTSNIHTSIILVTFIPASAVSGAAQAAEKPYETSDAVLGNAGFVIGIVQNLRANPPWRADLGAMDTDVHLRRPVLSVLLNPNYNYEIGVLSTAACLIGFPAACTVLGMA